MNVMLHSMGVRFHAPSGMLLLFAAIILLLSGCAREPVHMDYPLALGNAWDYQGTYTSKVATASIRLPVQSHRISVDQEMSNSRGKLFQCSLSIEGTPVPSMAIHMKKSDSRLMLCHGETEMLLISEDVQPGDQWKITIFNREFTLVARKLEEIKVPAGTYRALRIDFKGADNTEGSLWCVDKVGVAALQFRDCTERSPRTVRLELKEFSKVMKQEKSQGS
jgi:hypothetical protein